MTPEPAVDDRIDRYLQEEARIGAGARVVPLAGDASDRRYFRVTAVNGASSILALHAGPIDFGTLPFANVARLLEAMQLPVPAVIGHSNELGIVAVQDLGDVTLQARVAAAPEGRTALYREAVSLIEALQRRGAEFQAAGRSKGCLPYQLAFDVEKLTWELDFFVRHFIEGYRGAALSTAERRGLDEEWAAIAGELAAEPRVLCHRDYHSRNLMLCDERLYMIDFQDARMGPDTYDLASLLRDSYVDIPEHELDELIARFLATERDAAAGGGACASDFRRRFDLMSLQRNLKALGTFGYQTMTRRSTTYVQYMPRTLRYARTNLDAYPRFARLRTILAGHVDELR